MLGSVPSRRWAANAAPSPKWPYHRGVAASWLCLLDPKAERGCGGGSQGPFPPAVTEHCGAVEVIIVLEVSDLNC